MVMLLKNILNSGVKEVLLGRAIQDIKELVIVTKKCVLILDIRGRLKFNDCQINFKIIIRRFFSLFPCKFIA